MTEVLIETPIDFIPAQKPAVPKRQNGTHHSCGNGARTAYLRAAVEGELEKVATTSEGVRNHTLNTAAYSLGTLIHLGLDESEIESQLIDAAMVSGLSEVEAQKTVHSGLNAGKSNPRNIPDTSAGYAAAPQGTIAANTPCSVVANFKEFQEEEKKKRGKKAIPLLRILKTISSLPRPPKRTGGMLFADVDGVVRFMEKRDDLFAYIQEQAEMQWAEGSDSFLTALCTKGELFASLRATATNYLSVEQFPHVPEISGVYYLWRPPVGYEPNGTHFEKYLSFFDNWETEHDRALTRAAFLGTIWGGLPGARPAIISTAPDRGYGKSELLSGIGALTGGLFEVEPDKGKDDHLVTRLLSPAARVKRCIRIDNVKLSVSSALLESLITTSEFSGRQLFLGEGTRLNFSQFLISGNGLSLSRDLADRAFIIRLKKPTPRPGWLEDVRAYANEHRDKILADMCAILRKPAPYTTARDRWQSWVSEVLARATDRVDAIVAENQKRRDEYDEDLEEANLIGDALRQRAGFLQASFLSAAVACKAVNEALNTSLHTRTVGKIIKRYVDAGKLDGITKGDTRTERGWTIKPVSSDGPKKVVT
ncbi:MAG: hypothetical protein HZB26_07300 [Candidatus Hydrogenedentes bacterium]|nr:hypothetical protein [Candidatus Hydrogenedentota bacterium]